MENVTYITFFFVKKYYNNFMQKYYLRLADYLWIKLIIAGVILTIE